MSGNTPGRVRRVKGNHSHLLREERTVIYQLQLEIRGVVGFVKRQSNGLSEYDIVVPNTLRGEPRPGPRDPNEDRDAADGSELLRHDPILFVGDAAISLRGYWIRFDFQDQPAPVGLDAKGGSLPDMRLVAGDENCRVRKDYLPTSSAKIQPDTLAGFLKIDRGELATVPDSGDALSIKGLPKEIGKNTPRPGQTDLAAAALLWTVDFPEPPSGQLVVTAESASGGKRSIRVPMPDDGRVIPGHLMNHRAQLGHMHRPEKGKGDPDFKWFYEMLEIKRDIHGHYKGKGSLPFPKGGGAVSPDAEGIDTPCRPCEFCF